MRVNVRTTTTKTLTYLVIGTTTAVVVIRNTAVQVILLSLVILPYLIPGPIPIKRLIA